MITPARSLFLKIFLWFLMSLALLTALVAGIFKLDFHLRPESALITKLDEQGRALGRVILRELYDARYYEWGSILSRFGNAYDLELFICRSDGQVLAGPERVLPSGVITKLKQAEKDRVRAFKTPPHTSDNRDPNRRRNRRSPKGPPHMGPRDPGLPPFGLLPLPPPERLRFEYLLKTADPDQYWAFVAFPYHDPGEGQASTLFLLAASSTVTGNGLFFNPTPWLILAGVVLAASILLWIPLVKNITRPIGRITRTAEQIARGKFGVKVAEKRKDEIGRLGSAINHMSSQLEHHIMGQKRFLGDIAHELSSPLARMELGLGILEQRLEAEDLKRLEDIAEEVRHMSNLINELLNFTRAEIGPAKLKAGPVLLAPLLNDVIKREQTAGVEVVNGVDEKQMVRAVDNLLRRALCNVLRNAVRYAGHEGPIEISAQTEGNNLAITVKDQGPGVPESSLNRLFEPFYRPEAVRNRRTGGVGLGLAIVRTCVQACNGSVRAQNLTPRGFAVTMTFPLERGPKSHEPP